VRYARLAAAAAVASLALAPAASAALPPLGDGDGIHVVSQRELDARLTALTVSTTALPQSANVRILLPADYASNPNRRYPVLYLLHGTSGSPADWTTQGQAEQTTAGLEMIVVMPDIALNADGGGWCANWVGGGHPAWETFHIDQLIPWIDSNLRTIANRQGRAIAGLSQGGFCSMSYAARHPDLFETALSYSGAPDTAYDLEAQLLVTPVVNGTEVFLDHAPANAIFGDRLTNEINWAAHDPTTLASNLRDTNLFMYTGNGVPGPLDSGPPDLPAMSIEWGAHQLNTLFHHRLGALGISSQFDDYGAGTHSWPYWARDLRWSIGAVMADFTNPRPMPTSITYTSADPRYAIYGWQVTMHRLVREFSTLESAGRSGFTVKGSGSATVVTPAVYAPGGSFAVTVGSRRLIETASAAGTLTVDLPLGRSNTVQEYPLDGPPNGTRVYTKRVTIAPAS
jgi:S-formylglutathione hydrolase FrmB